MGEGCQVVEQRKAANARRWAFSGSVDTRTDEVGHMWPPPRAIQGTLREARTEGDRMTGSTSDLLSGIKTADVVDAMGRMHQHRCHVLDLVSPTPERTLFGRAITISFFPTCNAAMDPDRYNFANLFYEAVGDIPRDKVLVLASNGHPEISLGGSTKLSRVQNHGLAGVLADGRLRDFDELAKYDFATYCRGETTRWGGDTLRPFQANVPVVISGVGIVPGEFIFADASGAVVIPESQVEDVLEEARRVGAEDARFIEEIRGEDPSNGPVGGAENH